MNGPGSLSPAMRAAGWVIRDPFGRVIDGDSSAADPRDASPSPTDCLGSGQLLHMIGRGNFATCPVCQELVPVTDGALVTHASADAPPQPGGRLARPDGPSFGW